VRACSRVSNGSRKMSRNVSNRRCSLVHTISPLEYLFVENYFCLDTLSLVCSWPHTTLGTIHYVHFHMPTSPMSTYHVPLREPV
jgi:hypothetical protein